MTNSRKMVILNEYGQPIYCVFLTEQKAKKSQENGGEKKNLIEIGVWDCSSRRKDL